MSQIAKALVVLGLAIAAVGALVWLAERLGLGLGRLPGDLHFGGKSFSVSVPIVTSILISVVLTIVLNLWLRNR